MSLQPHPIRQILFAAALALSITFPCYAPDARAAGPEVCSVRDYGAAGDGLSLDTLAINAAIKACNARGGGRVVFAAGTYRSGTIYWLDNITLDLEAGATIQGSENLADYPSIPETSEWRNTALLVAYRAKNIAITGPGTIDGNGRAFIDPTAQSFSTSFDLLLTRQGKAWGERMSQFNEGPLKMKLRPGVLILVLHSQNIDVHDLHVVDAPNWGVKLMCSDHIKVKDLDVRNSLLIPNDDALDASNSTDVSITDSYLQAGDDALVIGGPCADGWCKHITENVFVNNVTLVSRSAAIRVGPAFAGVRNVDISDVTVIDSNRGIAVQTRSSEIVENITFSNITLGTRLIDGPWWGSGEPIAISAGKCDYVSWPSTNASGYIRHIKFNNVRATTQSPIVIYSSDPGHVQDVVFSGLQLTVKSSALTTILGGNLDLQPILPSSLDMVAENLSAIYTHNVDNLSFNHTTVRWQGEFPDYYRHALHADHFQGLQLDDFDGEPTAKHFAAIHLVSGSDVSIKGLKTHADELVDSDQVTGLKVK